MFLTCTCWWKWWWTSHRAGRWRSVSGGPGRHPSPSLESGCTSGPAHPPFGFCSQSFHVWLFQIFRFVMKKVIYNQCGVRPTAHFCSHGLKVWALIDLISTIFHHYIHEWLNNFLNGQMLTKKPNTPFTDYFSDQAVKSASCSLWLALPEERVAHSNILQLLQRISQGGAEEQSLPLGR